MINIHTLQNIEPFDGAANAPLTIAIGGSAQSKRWETITISWAQLVSVLKETKITDETYQEYLKLPKPEQAKRKDVGAFLGGGLSGPRRLKTAVTGRSAISLDFDGKEGKGMSVSLGELIELYQERFNFEACFSTTHTHHPDAPRVRLIIPLARTLSPAEYEPVARMIASELDVNEVDPASFSVAQCMFFSSSSKDGEFRFYHNPGELLDPDELLDRYEDWTDSAQWPRANKETPVKEPPRALDWDDEITSEGPREATGPIDPDAAVQAVKQWAERERENLKEYTNFISAMLVIVKAVQLNEIPAQTGRECVTLLAGERLDWQYNNLEKFEKELSNPDITTSYTFRKKFMYEAARSDPAEEFEFIEGTQETAKPAASIAEYRAGRIRHSAEELEDLRLDPIKFYINDMLPEGVGWLAGAPKVGKSYLAMQLAYAVATGTDFIGYKTNQAPVIYYSLEMVPQLIQERIKRLFPAGLPKDLYFYYDLLTFERGALDIVRADIKELQAGVVIIDVYGLVEKQKSNQKQLYNQAYPEIAQLRKLAEETGTAIILITHMNKGSENNLDPFNGLMGSTAMRGATDFNIALVKNPQDKKQIIFHEEGRKNKGIQLVLEMDNKAFFKNLGTTEELDIYQEKLAYKESPIAQCIARLLIDKTRAEIKATDLLEMLPAWWSYGKSNKRDTQSLGYGIKKMAFSLRKHDQITFTQERKMDGTYYTFERPKNKLTFVALQMESLDEAFSTP